MPKFMFVFEELEIKTVVGSLEESARHATPAEAVPFKNLAAKINALLGRYDNKI